MLELVQNPHSSSMPTAAPAAAAVADVVPDSAQDSTVTAGISMKGKPTVTRRMVKAAALLPTCSTLAQARQPHCLQAPCAAEADTAVNRANHANSGAPQSIIVLGHHS
jgi:hypothetical protein